MVKAEQWLKNSQQWFWNIGFNKQNPPSVILVTQETYDALVNCIDKDVRDSYPQPYELKFKNIPVKVGKPTLMRINGKYVNQTESASHTHNPQSPETPQE